MAKSPEELYQEREQRLRDCIDMKEPDKVPVVLTMNYFPLRYLGGGLTVADSYYNHEKWIDATVKTVTELAPDISGAAAGGSGNALSALNPQLFKWAGDGLGENAMHQYIEGEPLKAEEYPQFLADPGDYTLRTYLPRVWGALEPLAKLPHLQSLWGGSTLPQRSAAFADPEVIAAFEALAKAGREQQEFSKKTGGLQEKLDDLGFPAMQHGNAAAPFDVISDHLRGMAGTMIDMFRHPDELLEACDLVLQRSLGSIDLAKRAKRGNPKRVGSALHRGSDGFMSLKDFEKFYWPTLKTLIEATVEAGMVHVPFYEGNWEERLEHLLELPKGKTIARFALTDLKMAKDVLGKHSCIMGGVPHTLMQVASPSEIEDYCKDLFKTVGKGGGFILTTSTGLTHEAKPENVKAMIDATEKYGRY